VQVGGVGPGIPGTVVAFDVHDDLAVLRVHGLGLPALPIAPTAPVGTSVAILGYPLDGPFDAEPGRVGQTESVSTENAYGVGHVERTITALRGRVRPGNSGGPLVDAHGRVLATVFAALTTAPRPGGFAVPNSIVRTQLAHAHGPAVGTGRCGS
jgi:S1-C subfamily serine protease